MTQTAQDLWNDEKFIRKRMNEQIQYCDDIRFKRLRGEISEDRAYELIENATLIGKRFWNRLIDLVGCQDCICMFKQTQQCYCQNVLLLSEQLNSDVAQSGECDADIVEGNGS